MPLFVKAGSIVPTIPAIEHTGELNAQPITLNVFRGANGHFDLYEDDGVSYGYERGEYARIPIHYDDAKHTLVIGDRQGSYPAMMKDKKISVRSIEPGIAASAFDTPAQVIEYSGKEIVVNH